MTKTNVKRKVIREKVQGVVFDKYQLEGLVEDVICTIREAQKACFDKGYNHISIVIDERSEVSGYYETKISLLGDRKETDIEVKRRLDFKRRLQEKSKSQEEDKRERDLKNLKELANKYNVFLTFPLSA